MKKSFVPAWAVACVIGLLLTLGWYLAPVLADQPFMFAVHPETTLQTMVGFGSGFNESSLDDINAIQNPAERARAYDLLYGANELGTNLNIVRLTITSTAKPMSAPAAQGLIYNWEADQGTQAVWQAIQPVLKKNRVILYAVPFTPPVQWKTNHQPTHGGALMPARYMDYADYLADFVDYYQRVLHVDIDVLSLQNEPGVAAPWNSCIWTGTELRDFLKVLAPRIQAQGLNPKLMLSEGTNWSGAWLHLQPALQDATALPLVNIMASHSYGPPQDNTLRAKFAAASVEYGRPVWMTEMSIIGPPEDDGMDAAMRIAQCMQRDLVEGRASAWIYCFAVFRPYTHHIKGSLSVLSVAKDGSLVVPKRFWAMAHYSHFVRPGWKRVQIDGFSSVNAGFINPEGNGFARIVLNATAKPQSAIYDFGNWRIGAVEAFCTTEKLDMYHDQDHHVLPLAINPHQFTTKLLPRSITTFTGSIARQ
jgi:O-glycosyl hydrolase